MFTEPGSKKAMAVPVKFLTMGSAVAVAREMVTAAPTAAFCVLWAVFSWFLLRQRSIGFLGPGAKRFAGLVVPTYNRTQVILIDRVPSAADQSKCWTRYRRSNFVQCPSTEKIGRLVLVNARYWLCVNICGDRYPYGWNADCICELHYEILVTNSCAKNWRTRKFRNCFNEINEWIQKPFRKKPSCVCKKHHPSQI